MQFQDIQISDLVLRAQFVSLWRAGNYQAALALLQEAQAAGKWQSADNFNALCDAIVAMENKKDNIPESTDVELQATQPTQDIGGIWFEAT